MRNLEFANGEFYHVCNRGVDKRNIVDDAYDANRFVQGLIDFNTIKPRGGLYEISFQKEKGNNHQPLVNIIAYCLNPNHFHLLLEQVVDQGISKFLHRLCGGHTQYFNLKYDRKGTLFQGPFRAKHVDSDEYLLHVSAYVNLNNRVHQLSTLGAKLVRSSWNEYENQNFFGGICKKDIILDQFGSPEEYKEFTLASLPLMIERKEEERGAREEEDEKLKALLFE